MQWAKDSPGNAEEEKTAGVITQLSSKIYYKATVIKSQLCWYKQLNVTEWKLIYSHHYVIHDKDDTATQRKKDALFHKQYQVNYIFTLGEKNGS